MVRCQAWLGPDLDTVYRCTFDPLGPGWISSYVLLLSRRVLQGILGRPSGVCRRRTAERLSWRTQISAHTSKRPSLFHVSCARILVILSYDVYEALGSQTDAVRRDLGSASARLCYSLTCCCWEATRSGVIVCGTLSGDAAISCRINRSNLRLTNVSVPLTASICFLPG